MATRMLINLNGTGAEDLLRQHLAVRDAAAALLKALDAAFPNGRDFQTVSDRNAHREELEAHRRNWTAVCGIQNEAQASLEALAEQPAGAKAWTQMRESA